MARREIIEVTCDICGAVLDGEVSTPNRPFGIDGQRYVIDLCAIHATEFGSLVAPFVTAGRQASGRPSRVPVRRGRSRSTKRTSDPKAIRAWARTNGFPKVSERGRVPGEILVAWQAAQGGSAPTNGNVAKVRRTRTAKKAPSTKRRAASKRAAAGRKAAAASSN